MKRFLAITAVILLLTSVTVSAQSDTTEFTKADSIAKLYPRFSLDNLPLLSYKLTSDLPSEPDKFRAIYTWVCLNISNDADMFMQNQAKRAKLQGLELEAWNNKLRRRMFEELPKEYKTVCTGYAYLIRELAHHAGIESVIVDGYGRTIRSNIGSPPVVNHSWNAVKLNGKWFLCDATWSSGAITSTTHEFVSNYNDAYFLADPRTFIRNHSPVDTTWALVSENPSLEQFISRPIIYVDAFRHGVIDLSPDSLDITATKNAQLTFRMKVNAKIDALKITFRYDGSVQNIKPDYVSYKTTEVFVYHKPKRRGRHDIHLLIDNKYVATWRINVVK